MVWERIRQKEAEKERVAREEAENARATAEQNARREREQLAHAVNKVDQERRAREERAWKLMSESQIIKQLTELRNGIRGKKDIVVNRGNASVTLAWGRYHATGTPLTAGGIIFLEGSITYSSFTRVKDYSYMEIKFDLNDESMAVKSGSYQDRKLASNQWRNQRNLVTDALAEAYLNPRRVKTTERDDNLPTPREPTPECCCH